jgi:hypothetical protein
MTTHTPQQLGRTSDLLANHDHDPKVMCLHCFWADLENFEDFRADLALLAIAQMKRLVFLRYAAGGVSMEQAWHGVFDAPSLMSDIASVDPERSIAASEFREVLGDYIQHRVILQHPEPRPLELTQKQHEIVARTLARMAAIEAEGREPGLFPPTN